jgi:hypothetical protein
VSTTIGPSTNDPKDNTRRLTPSLKIKSRSGPLIAVMGYLLRRTLLAMIIAPQSLPWQRSHFRELQPPIRRFATPMKRAADIS